MLMGKVCLITGGSRGIGRATSLHLASLGMDVSIIYSKDSSSTDAEKVAEEIRKMGRKALTIKADVRDADAVEIAVEETERSLGPIFLLVNNAGVFPRKPGRPSVELSEEEWDWLMDTNLKGAFLTTKAVARRMLRRGEGRIVNVASVAGIVGSKSGCHYAASKGGIIQLTYSWADEFKGRILVNAIAPGPVSTSLLRNMPEERMRKLVEECPMNRIASPEEIAEAIAFLASHPFINGQVLVVDGGRIKH